MSSVVKMPRTIRMNHGVSRTLLDKKSTTFTYFPIHTDDSGELTCAISPGVTCRDVLLAHYVTAKLGLYGLSLTYGTLFSMPLDLDPIRIGIVHPGYGTNSRIVKILKEAESVMGVHESETTDELCRAIPLIGSPCNMFMITLDKVWLSSPVLFSLATLIIREVSFKGFSGDHTLRSATDVLLKQIYTSNTTEHGFNNFVLDVLKNTSTHEFCSYEHLLDMYTDYYTMSEELEDESVATYGNYHKNDPHCDIEESGIISAFYRSKFCTD